MRQYRKQFVHFTDADFFESRSYEGKLGIQAIKTAEWLAWVALLYRPYFEQAWIVQEITMSRRLVLTCGRHMMQRLDFAKAAL